MEFKTLESSELKDKYFYRTVQWDWLTLDMIHVFDYKNSRVITMDYWPQEIYLGAQGQRTVSEFIHFIASSYARTQVPKTLDVAIIEELTKLVNDLKVISLSDCPVNLDSSILNPLTEEGEIDMEGIWVGTYTYVMPEAYKDERTQKVEFTLTINSIIKNQFVGSVEDNLTTGGTPGVGKIKGTFTEFGLAFEKNMPVYARIELGGTHSIDKNIEHPTIIYTGEFSRSKKRVTGTWKFKKKVLVWKGIIPFWISSGNGYFSMEKQKNNE